jgi:hypothetical protein
MALLPPRLVEFLNRSTMGAIATRDASNRPSEHTVFGVKAGADRRHLTVLVPLQVSEDLAENLANGGRVAATFGIASNECYQLKGRAVDVHPARDDERPILEATMGRIIEEQIQTGAPPDMVGAMKMMKLWPAISVTIEVDRAFVQTPGPEAGRDLPLEG